MALDRASRYSGRYDAPTLEQPQGAFKNRTAAGLLDGSYLERDWCNDWSGFFSSLLVNANFTANGLVDEVGASQYFEAASSVFKTGRKNYVLNGGCNVAQRGTSVTNTNQGYSLDQWWSSFGNSPVNQVRFADGQTEVEGNPEFYIDVTGVPAVVNQQFGAKIENIRTLAGKTITCSFWIKSTEARTMTYRVLQSYNISYTQIVIPLAAEINVTTSWQKFVFTVDMPPADDFSVATGSQTFITFLTLSTIVGSVQVAQHQVEEGSVATAFEYRPYSEELWLCQRYFYTTTRRIVVYAGRSSTTATNRYANITYPNKLRANPTVTAGSLNSLAVANLSSVGSDGFYFNALTASANDVGSVQGYTASAEL